ncbi:uncharacterized protein PHALS_01349 [Plasmopara halstedii]|uniref:Uncharacterized protein n=1 Tax=Plasmopara halstedii TaxID=4781 RepID=A0A0P1AUI0_PLAHL|nr:uncharacterized protein PHALS_01349 [Plasmopara halstedii]CEG45026.1 hypothetical protein PHALS_01349 [Plasmopara halstedii]|eukprot:XP_024581395.1 hypothetical protein PHALS_01349 [Plasmopara halstedii]
MLLCSNVVKELEIPLLRSHGMSLAHQAQAVSSKQAPSPVAMEKDNLRAELDQVSSVNAG